tara:strand:- start:12653 stop:13123 length:471 start_codon:yes stop_codon:yes gene_type:complete
MKFDYTDNSGNVYSDGSTSTAKQISIDKDEIFDRTYAIAGGTATEILSDAKLTDFDFLWIESNTAGDIQLVCNEGGLVGDTPPGLANAWVVRLTPGIPFILPNDDSMNRSDVTLASNYISEQDAWETHWTADTIDRIEWYHSDQSVTAKIRVFAAT